MLRVTERNPGASPSKIDGGTMEEPPSDIPTLSDLGTIVRRLKVKKIVLSKRQICRLENAAIRRLKNKGILRYSRGHENAV